MAKTTKTLSSRERLLRALSKGDGTLTMAANREGVPRNRMERAARILEDEGMVKRGGLCHFENYPGRPGRLFSLTAKGRRAAAAMVRGA